MSLLLDKENSAYSSLTSAMPTEVRMAIRQNRYAGHTAGLCDGFLQCNLVIIPQYLATDFENYCANNPIPCPVLGQSKVGEYCIEDLGEGIDLRTDLPYYNIYEHGKFVRSARDIKANWQEDFIAFAIGCSFTFERALMASGIGMRHIEEDVTVPMFKTNIATNTVGPFGGPTVVSMRPIKPSDLNAVHQICASFPHAHGVPIHIGDPSKIGIADLNTPDWGNAVSINKNEIPVFWGCGVTTQMAIENARPAISITHAPGAMLITKIDEKPISDRRPAELSQRKIN